MANGAGAVMAWVNGRRTWVAVLLWVLLFWVLLPLFVVNRTGGSRNGLIGAGLLLMGFLVLGAVGGDEPTGQDERLAVASDIAPTESPPEPTPEPTPSSTPAPSPTSATPADEPTDDEPSDEATQTVSEPAAGPRGDGAPSVYVGNVGRVIDGDTFDLPDGTRVRIAIVDTPEVSSGVEACGPEAEDFTRSFLAGEQIAIYRPAGGPANDPNGRLLGEVVRLSDDASLNVALVVQGLGRVDDRFTSEDPDLTSRLREAARRADTPSCAADDEPETSQPAPPVGEPAVTIGYVLVDGPGNDVEIYNDSEYVELRNNGDTDVDLGGWAIIDLKDNQVTIPAGYRIAAGATFRVYSGNGDNDPSSRYFANRSQAYINNSGGDELRLVDATGTVIDIKSV